MENAFLNLLNVSITAGWIVLVVLLLRFALKKAPKWAICLLWAIVGIRLILPVSLESVFSLLPETDPVNTETYQVQTGIPVLDNAVNDYWSNHVSVPENSGTAAPDSVGTASGSNVWEDTLLSILPAQAKTVEPVTVFSWIWIVGVVALLLYSVLSWLVVRRKVREGVHFRENIYFCDHVNSAFILGVVRPRIYLASDLPETQLGYVIGHEKAHLHRWDHLWKPLGFLLLSIHWFNPLMWVAYILLCRDIELACDERVIRGMDPEAKKGYSETLVACSAQRRMIIACPVAFGEVAVKERVKSVANYKKPTFWVLVIAIVACIAVSVCFLTDPVKGYTYQEVTKVYEALQAEVAEDGITEEDYCLAYAELFRMVSQGTKSKTDQFAELIREITNNSVEFQNDQVFELAESYVDLYTKVAGLAALDTYDVWLGDISDSQAELRINYLDGIHYSVRMIEIGERLSVNGIVPYQGEFGNYLMEISFEDGAVISTYPSDSIYHSGGTYMGSKYAMYFRQYGTDGATNVIYVGSDYPFSVEEQTGVEINWPSGTVSVILDFTEYTQMDSETALAEPVIFPNAPVTTTIRDLPETYDVSDLVWPYWQQQFQFNDVTNTEFYVSIPYIYPFSEDAIACRRKIYELFKNKAEWPLDLLTEHKQRAVHLDKPEDIFFDQDQYRMCYSYQAGCYNDVLSVVVRINGTDVPWSNYYTYYLDLTTGKRLTQDEANARYAVDKADIKRAVEAYVYERYPNFDQLSAQDQEWLRKNFSDENIEKCLLFSPENGKLMILANVYSLEAVNITQQIVELLV